MAALSIPSEGTKKITDLLEHQQQRLTNIENQMQPTISSVKDWATQTFTFPIWLETLIFAAFGIGILALCSVVFKHIKTFLSVIRCSQAKIDNHSRQEYTQMAALYPLCQQSIVQLEARLQPPL